MLNTRLALLLHLRVAALVKFHSCSMQRGAVEPVVQR